MDERKFNIGDKVISDTCRVGVIHDLFDNEMYGVLFNDKVLDAVTEDSLRPYDDEISDQSKYLFEGVKFGDKFLTQGGKIAIFLHKNPNGDYRFGTDLETYSVDEYGRAWDYTVLNIVGKIEDIDEEKLNELAYEYAEKASDYEEIVCQNDIDAFKAGYRKAKEE